MTWVNDVLDALETYERDDIDDGWWELMERIDADHESEFGRG